MHDAHRRAPRSRPRWTATAVLTALADGVDLAADVARSASTGWRESRPDLAAGARRLPSCDAPVLGTRKPAEDGALNGSCACRSGRRASCGAGRVVRRARLRPAGRGSGGDGSRLKLAGERDGVLATHRRDRGVAVALAAGASDWTAATVPARHRRDRHGLRRMPSSSGGRCSTGQLLAVVHGGRRREGRGGRSPRPPELDWHRARSTHSPCIDRDRRGGVRRAGHGGACSCARRRRTERRGRRWPRQASAAAAVGSGPAALAGLASTDGAPCAAAGLPAAGRR